MFYFEFYSGVLHSTPLKLNSTPNSNHAYRQGTITARIVFFPQYHAPVVNNSRYRSRMRDSNSQATSLSVNCDQSTLTYCRVTLYYSTQLSKSHSTDTTRSHGLTRGSTALTKHYPPDFSNTPSTLGHTKRSVPHARTQDSPSKTLSLEISTTFRNNQCTLGQHSL